MMIMVTMGCVRCRHWSQAILHRWYQVRETFFPYSFYQRRGTDVAAWVPGGCGRKDIKRTPAARRHNVLPCVVLAFSLETRCGKRIHISKFLHASVDFAPFLVLYHKHSQSVHCHITTCMHTCMCTCTWCSDQSLPIQGTASTFCNRWQ